VARVRGGGDERGELVDPHAPADLLELAAALELVGERDRVHGLALGVEVERRLVDQRVARPVEVARRQDFADRPDRTGGEHHRAEDRLLGIEILRWDRGGRRSLGELVHARQLNHLPARPKRAWTTRFPHGGKRAGAGRTEHMFLETPDGAVEEKAARSALFLAISPGRPHGLWRDRYGVGSASAGTDTAGVCPRSAATSSVGASGVSAASGVPAGPDPSGVRSSGSSPPSGTTIVRTVAVTSAKSSTGTS